MKQRRSQIEIWGGIECTVCRRHDNYIDQIELTGHAHRLSDLDLLADLGIRTVRYPVLWERVAPTSPTTFDWAWTDERLSKLRVLDIRPIATLLHHGSGPLYTDLLNDNFVTTFATFAGAVAKRYPWIKSYTPINEPLTTARFSALYGHWYPHAKDDRSFVKALLNQVFATRSAMKSIRETVPDAQFVQTEDACTVFSTPELAYQAEFENTRKWLSLDLLCGRVSPSHPLYHYLIDAGADAQSLYQLARDPCPPDLIGLNYYVTSDRFLDENISHYPPCTHGGNGRDVYADIEAVRVCHEGITGHQNILSDAYERYKIPVSLTEVHLGGGDCEQQTSWLRDAWHGAHEARNNGVDVRSITLWSVFGAVDWDSLLTQSRGYYEPGLFDVCSGKPIPTNLEHNVRTLCQTLDFPSKETIGWWRHPSRLLYASKRVNHYKRSCELYDRAKKTIPGGGHLSGRPLLDLDRAPLYFYRGKGSRCWDVDGNEYIDFLMAYGAYVLGYADSGVNHAAFEQADQGTLLSLNHPLHVHYVEKLLSVIPGAESAIFFKTGSEATTAALRIARQHTSRQKVVRCGYHGWHDWCLPEESFVPFGLKEQILSFDGSSLDSLQQKLEANRNEVAAVIIAPEMVVTSDGHIFLEIAELTHSHGAVFVLDEIKTGFRIKPVTFQSHYNFTPDLTTLSKALGNGWPMAAVVGKEEVMRAASGLHLSATYHGDVAAMAASIATIDRIQSEPVLDHVWQMGERLIAGINQAAARYGIPAIAYEEPLPPMPFLRFCHDDADINQRLIKTFYSEIYKQGILFHPRHLWFISYAHSVKDIDLAIDASCKAMAICQRHLVV